MALNRFKFSKAKAQGLSHIDGGNIPCQDSVEYLTRVVDGSSLNVIALSDGCSSSGLSHFGSDITVKTATAYLADHFHELLEEEDRVKVSRSIIEAVINAQLKDIGEDKDHRYSDEKANHPDRYQAFVEKYGAAIKSVTLPEGITLDTLFYLHSLNATLLFVAECNDEWICGQCGDGYIFRLTTDGALEIAMMEDKEGEHNATDYPQSAYLMYLLMASRPEEERRNVFPTLLRLMRSPRPKEGEALPKSPNGWVCISDGPENTLVVKQGRYQHVSEYVWNVLLSCTINETHERAEEILNRFFAGPLRKSTRKHGGDDISMVLMVDPNPSVDCISFPDKDLDEKKRQVEEAPAPQEEPVKEPVAEEPAEAKEEPPAPAEEPTKSTVEPAEPKFEAPIQEEAKEPEVDHEEIQRAILIQMFKCRGYLEREKLLTALSSKFAEEDILNECQSLIDERILRIEPTKDGYTYLFELGKDYFWSLQVIFRSLTKGKETTMEEVLRKAENGPGIVGKAKGPAYTPLVVLAFLDYLRDYEKKVYVVEGDKIRSEGVVKAKKALSGKDDKPSAEDAILMAFIREGRCLNAETLEKRVADLKERLKSTETLESCLAKLVSEGLLLEEGEGKYALYEGLSKAVKAFRELPPGIEEGELLSRLQKAYPGLTLPQLRLIVKAFAKEK